MPPITAIVQGTKYDVGAVHAAYATSVFVFAADGGKIDVL
jgi:hypothetical protein